MAYLEDLVASLPRGGPIHKEAWESRLEDLHVNEPFAPRLRADLTHELEGQIRDLQIQPIPRERPGWGERVLAGIANVATVGLGGLAGVGQLAASAAAPRAEPLAQERVMPNGFNGGLVATNGGAFPWATLIQQVGAVAGQVLPALVNGHRRNGGSLGGATPFEPGAVMPTAMGAGGFMSALGAGTALAVRGARAVVGPILARIAGNIGRRVSAKNVVALVRRVGPEAAAAALGVTAAELLQLTASETMRPRRRRGISARDISRCRSTIRRMRSFMSMLPSPPRRSSRGNHAWARASAGRRR